MGNHPAIKAARLGDPQFATMIELQDLMRAAVADFIGNQADPELALSLLGTAAAMFAGTQYGALIAMGAFTDQDKRRIIDAIAASARQGIEVGKRRTARLMNTPEGHA